MALDAIAGGTTFVEGATELDDEADALAVAGGIDVHRTKAVAVLSREGKSRFGEGGWHWLQDGQGYWWGARSNREYILQVESSPPDFPTRRWNATSGAGYTPMPQWDPLRLNVEMK